MSSFIDYAFPAASIGAGLASTAMNYFSQRENRDIQIDLMREQNRFQREMFQKQLDANSPSALVQKLSAAGLNPSLAFGDAAQTGLASAGSAPSVSAPEVNFSDIANNAALAFATVTAGRKDAEEAKGVNIDNMTRNAMNLLTLEQMDSQRGLNDVSRAYIRLQERLLNMSMPSQVEGFALANQESRMRSYLLSKQAENVSADNALKQIEYKLQEWNLKYQPKQLEGLVYSTFAQGNQYNAAAGYYGSLKEGQNWQNYLNRRYGASQITTDLWLKKVQASGIDISNKQALELLPFIKEGMKLQNQLSGAQYQGQLMNMIFQPLQLGKGLFESVGLGSAALLGRGKAKDMFKPQYGDNLDNWHPSYSR